MLHREELERCQLLFKLLSLCVRYPLYIIQISSFNGFIECSDTYVNSAPAVTRVNNFSTQHHSTIAIAKFRQRQNEYQGLLLCALNSKKFSSDFHDTYKLDHPFCKVFGHFPERGIVFSDYRSEFQKNNFMNYYAQFQRKGSDCFIGKRFILPTYCHRITYQP